MKLPSKQRLIKEARSWGIFAAILGLFYLANTSIQNHLGEQAFAATGLENRSLAEALEIAQQQNKRVVADLSAYWCGSCRAMDKHVLSNQMVKDKLNADYVFARIDSESPEADDFIRRYGARGYPTVIILDKHGNKLRTLPNTTSPHKFVSFL